MKLDEKHKALMRRKQQLALELEQLRQLGHKCGKELVVIEEELETLRGQLEAEAVRS